MQAKSVGIQDNWQEGGALVYKILVVCKVYTIDKIYSGKTKRNSKEISFSTHSLENLKVMAPRTLLHIPALLWFFLGIFCQKVGNPTYPLQKIYSVYQFRIGNRYYQNRHTERLPRISEASRKFWQVLLYPEHIDTYNALN